MTKSQKEALLTYLEFHLISLVEGVQDDTSGVAQSKLYKHAHNILIDVEDALDTLIEPKIQIKR